MYYVEIFRHKSIKLMIVSNYWLEKELGDSDKDLNYKLKIKLDAKRVVFCV